VQQLKDLLSHHVYEVSSIDVIDDLPGDLGVSWHVLQEQVLVWLSAQSLSAMSPLSRDS
jgi:hypothetical protein